ncbi:MAG TPA: hypothetical protein PLV68_08770, partial [Ilumatobacteraceae bacterium]|nr:hypothetical protein [Ilumatobacteraceae bacterium]
MPEQLLRVLVGSARVGVRALEGEPLDGVVAIDDAVPANRLTGPVCAELDDVTTGEPAGNDPTSEFRVG